MSFDSSDERIVDYRNYDFRAVWVGRDHVDRFDRALLECALDHLDLRRTLEIGTGFGRLTPRILQGNGQYVGIDYDLGGVRDAHDAAVRAGPADSHRAWFAANVYHLPFASGSFSSICMVRVHHHLADPVRALREIARVLVPGGTALITYNDRTGFRSLIHDTGVALGLRGVAHDRKLLFAREGHLQVREVPTRQYITSPAQFARDLQSAGLEAVCSFGGPETTAARVLPLRLGLFAGRAWPAAPIFSSQWVVVRKGGQRTQVRAWEDILACPQCGQAGPGVDRRASSISPCPACGFVYREDGGILDVRYVADARPDTPSSEAPNA
jgi:SAM-dependent methyltransferase